MSVATLNTKATEAVTAIEDGDYETARKKLEACKVLLATIPNAEHGGESKLEWDREAIDEMLRIVNRRLGANTGIQTTKVKYVRPTD